ncbi:hypothetical protein BMS3Bbin02_01197 [bacterium BMS3Bbin02]|nr:hypothetical protein BMS3Bbin02_01197 [bacterium BMS3Bbin02]
MSVSVTESNDAVFVMVDPAVPASTVATMVRVSEPPLVIVPTVQIPLA